MRPKKTITIDLSSYLNDGTYNLYVKSRGTNVRESASSNSVSCTVQTAITCTVSGLGSSSPSSVVFTKDAGFTVQGLGIEDVELNGNVFVKIPKLYRKVNSVSDGQITSFTIATAQVDSDYYPYPCFVDENGNELPYILIGKYFNKNSSGMNSVASGSSVSQTLAVARPYAQALGTGYQLYDWMMMRMWQDLIICIMETVDTNNGSGLQTDALGISWETYGFWVDGVIKGTTNYWWICNKPSSYVSLSSTSDGIPTDYVATDYLAPTTGNYVSKLGYDSSNPFANFVAGASSSSYTQYYCDGYYYSSGSRPFYSRVGNVNAYHGAFFVSLSNDWSDSNRVRLCYRPLTTNINVEEEEMSPISNGGGSE